MDKKTQPAELVPITSTSIVFSETMLGQLEKFANLMATGKSTVPAHLQGKPADCMAIAMQASQWKMNPFAVAQKTHLVSGTLGYEAQLVNAVITSMAPTKDRLHFDWFGPWAELIDSTDKVKEKGCGVKVWATMKGEDEPRELELFMSQASVRNSPLWKSDPKQQLAYLAVKRWSRLYCPDVIMGVYTPDELNEIQPEKDITPEAKTESLNEAIKGSQTVEGANQVAPEIDVEAVIKAIQDASNTDELKAALADGEKLKGDDLTRARTAYHEKVAAINAARQNTVTMSYAEIAEALDTATTQEEFDIACDLINSIQDKQQKAELISVSGKAQKRIDEDMFGN